MRSSSRFCLNKRGCMPSCCLPTHSPVPNSVRDSPHRTLSGIRDRPPSNAQICAGQHTAERREVCVLPSFRVPGRPGSIFGEAQRILRGISSSSAYVREHSASVLKDARPVTWGRPARGSGTPLEGPSPARRQHPLPVPEIPPLGPNSAPEAGHFSTELVSFANSENNRLSRPRRRQQGGQKGWS